MPDLTIPEPLEQSVPSACRLLSGDDPAAFENVLTTVARARFTTFLGLQGELTSLCPADCEASGFLAAAFEILLLESNYRAAVVGHPIFRIWVALAMREANARLTGRADNSRPLRARLDGFAEMLDRVQTSIAERRAAGDDGNRPAFHRLDMDPLLAEVLPPSYVVPQEPEERRARLSLGHPLSFFRDVVGVALDRIAVTWPGARTQFDRLVQTVLYLPDGDFRSCSASRYTGVILLSARDRSILDLEESLVHESGHQLLYTIVEATPITIPDTESQFGLPWSGQVRDLYGYFHAFFIYVILARFHERAMDRAGPEGAAAADRLRSILHGLQRALPDFQVSSGLTAAGRDLLDGLANHITALSARHSRLVGGG